jgi:hypothetical protein
MMVLRTGDYMLMDEQSVTKQGVQALHEVLGRTGRQKKRRRVLSTAFGLVFS